MSSDSRAEGAPRSPADEFSAARHSLRETIKWLIAALAAIAAAIIGGSTLAGLGSLAGANLPIAAVAGVVALASVLYALYLALELLISDSFYLSSLNEPSAASIKAKLEKYQADLLSVRFACLDDFLDSRVELRRRVLEFDKLPESEKAAKKVAIDSQYAAIAACERMVATAGHFELLSERASRRIPQLLRLSFLAAISLVVVVWAVGNKSLVSPVTTALSIDPGKDWITVGKAIAAKCGESPLRATLRETPRYGWVVLDLQAGPDCENIIITVPASIVAAPIGSIGNPVIPKKSP